MREITTHFSMSLQSPMSNQQLCVRETENINSKQCFLFFFICVNSTCLYRTLNTIAALSAVGLVALFDEVYSPRRQ